MRGGRQAGGFGFARPLVLPALSDDEGAAFNAGIDSAARSYLAECNYGDVLVTRGMTPVALTGDGRLVE
ncbi:hypothetical protein CG716_27555 [Mycolicibacterium sphagni]|uniref:Uncharacterized protein n=1 Tax=Mycolicibacterium sphagni TaxID=1786 RepID=A0A255DCQ8_9MYCO|nr:hypothetical protein CG716_27555 [Mycolicibacterium sphagni]